MITNLIIVVATINLMAFHVYLYYHNGMTTFEYIMKVWEKKRLAAEKKQQSDSGSQGKVDTHDEEDKHEGQTSVDGLRSEHNRNR